VTKMRIGGLTRRRFQGTRGAAGPGRMDYGWMDCMVRPCGCGAVRRLERSRRLSFKFASVRIARKEPESFNFFFLIMRWG
jgi:hypothetical protein